MHHRTVGELMTRKVVRAQRDMPIKEIVKLTTGKWKGKYDCKYMYAANYADLGCWGFASDKHKLGGWIVLGSHEYFSDGPTKQDLTGAVGTGLLHLNMNHYNGSSFTIRRGQSWKKIYGPWLMYFNDKQSGDDCWHDAQEQSKAESAAFEPSRIRAA